MRKTDYYRNIKKLWTSHLKLAILDLNGKDIGLQRDALFWLNSNDPVFPSFCSICEMLNQNVESLRMAIFKNRMEKKDFRKKHTGQCCECGKRFPVVVLQKLDFYRTYICQKCKYKY